MGVVSDTDLTAVLRSATSDALPRAIDDLRTLVAIPSISADAFDPRDVLRSAEAVRDLAEETGVFDEVGIHTATIPETGRQGHPAVLAVRRAAPGKPHLLLYAHHDVQPMGDEKLWTSPPLEATERDGRLFGRGTGDDKGGVMTHLAALRVLRTVLGDDLGVGVTLFVEGEEESGSRSFGQFLTDHHDNLAADLIIVTDAVNWDTRTPGVTVSLRGTTRFTLTVRTLDHGLHSGMFGGAVPDAMLAAITLLGTLWDHDGSVAVSGLERREADTPEYSEQRLREESELPASTATIGRGKLLDRLWNQPSITVTGIDAPSVAEASNTLSPEVTVVLSARVSPSQDPRRAYEAIRDHLLAHAPFGARLEFSDVDYGAGFLGTDNWAAADARSALAEAYGVPPVDLGVGGSIPFIADLATQFPDAAVVVTAVMDPQGSPHSPNESLDLATFEKAILAEALLLVRLARR